MSAAVEALANATEAQKKIAETLRTTTVPPRVRAETITYIVNEHGLDVVPPLEGLIREADEGRALKAQAKAAEDERHPLTREYYLDDFSTMGEPYAVVTNGPGDTYIPVKKEEIRGLKCGDPLLIDLKTGKIAGRDGALAPRGEVARIETLYTDGTNRIVITHHDMPIVATVSQRVLDDGEPLDAQQRVIFDPLRRMVLGRVKEESDGHELLTPIEDLKLLSRNEIGAPHPILDDMLFRMKSFARHGEWIEQLKMRPTSSYLLAGPTGTGKSTLLKVLAKELSEFVYELTGQWVSRLVMADSSTFYSPWFGETETKIVSWFKRLRKLGKIQLKAKDGSLIRVPLIIALEEGEALLRSRGMDMGGSGHLFDRTLSLILQQCSSVGYDLDCPACLCITSNKMGLLDAAAVRRFGMRKAIFGSLSAGQTISILEKKLTLGLPLRRSRDFANGEAARHGEINRIAAYLFGEDPDQAIAEVRLVDGSRRPVHRRQLITPALLEEAVSAATDDCLKQSDEAGEMLGIDGDAVIGHLQKQFESLAVTLRPYNLEDYLPDWFTEETIRVESIRPLIRHPRRPRATQLLH